MAGRERKRKGASAGARKAKASAHKAAAKPVLGNDPFERGAAVRSSAPTPSPRPSPPAGETEAPAPAPIPAAPPTATSTTIAATAAALRDRLASLEQRVEATATDAAVRLGDLARQEASGQHARDLLQALTGLLPALRERLSGLAALRSLFAGTGELDFYGMDRDLVHRAAPVLDFLYESWWRVEVRGAELVPPEGPLVVVANHGGALPWDALVLRLALLRSHPVERELRPLLDEHALKMPLVGGLAARLGAVPATPEHALRLLGEGRAVGVFPEGSRVAARPWPRRYQVERFGRGGFAKLALRAGAPIVACAIVGSEETSAPFARPGWLAEQLGMPFLGTGSALPLAPMGLFPLPSRWSLRFGEPIATRDLGAAAADDPARVLELTERTRASLQQMLDEDVAARRSVYL